jgi:hypothetical protein
MKRMIAITAAALCASASLLPAAAAAQTAEPWKWTGAISLYMPTVGGKTVFSQPAPASDISVNTDDLLGVKGFFMGSLEANNGRWGGFTDVVYLNVGGSKSGSSNINVGGAQLPVGASANAHLDIKGWAWTLAGTYRAVTKPDYTMDVIGGARLLDVKQTLDWNLAGNVGSIALPGRAGNLDTSLSNWDAIIGVKGRYAFGEGKKWFAPYYLDVGTGNSDLTLQAVAGIGYSFKWGDVLASWRYIDYKMKSGSKIEDMNFSGPAVSAVFHW